MSFHVYKITNKINGKVYIGCTTNSVRTRWKGHLSAYKHLNEWTRTALYDAMTEYGTEQFIVEELEECLNREVMIIRERYWIRHFSSMVPDGYNMICKSIQEGKAVTK